MADSLENDDRSKAVADSESEPPSQTEADMSGSEANASTADLQPPETSASAADASTADIQAPETSASEAEASTADVQRTDASASEASRSTADVKQPAASTSMPETMDVSGTVQDDSMPTLNASESVATKLFVEPSSDILRKIIVPANASGRSLEEELEDEDIEEEEEEAGESIPSGWSNMTYDCVDEECGVKVVEEGYFGGRVITWDPCFCKKKECSFRALVADEKEFTWSPTLASAKAKKDMQTKEFKNLDNLMLSLDSSLTYIEKSYFDSTMIFPSGETPVECYTLGNDRLEVDVINLGATVTSIRIRDGEGWVDVALGFDNAASYLDSRSDCLGGTIGRVANKIPNGRFKLPYENEEYQLSKNDGKHHSNGGFKPLHKRMWSARRWDDRLVMFCRTYDKEDGYPGDVLVWVCFSLSGDGALNIEYYAEADCVTPINITNGIAFNLAGHDSGPKSIYDHAVFVNSELCCDSTDFEGKMGLVYETPYNLTDLKHIGCVLTHSEDTEIDVTYGLYRKKQSSRVTESAQANMLLAAVLRHEDTGRTLVISTDQWGLRLHTCNKLKKVQGKGRGTVYDKHSGIALQPGNLPNAVNIEHYPDSFICPLLPYHHKTRYHFSTVKERGSYMNRKPWLQDNVTFLSCDEPMEEEENEQINKEQVENEQVEGEQVEKEQVKNQSVEEEKLPYSKTYKVLEKLAPQECSNNTESELSNHSSFTSFGSELEGPPQDGRMALDEVEAWPVDEHEEEMSKSSESVCSPKIKVKQPIPLPPHLSGKWPLPTTPKVCMPTPTKKECLRESAKIIKSEKPKEAPVKKSTTANKSKLGDESGKRTSKRSVHTVEPVPYKKLSVGVVRREEEKGSTKYDKAKPSIGTNVVHYLQDLTEGDLKNVANPVLSGSQVFRWFEPSPLLPWYPKFPDAAVSKESVLPESERKQMMGKIFRLINFPEDFLTHDVKQKAILRSIKVQMECLKGQYYSINYPADNLSEII